MQADLLRQQVLLKGREAEPARMELDLMKLADICVQ